MPVDFKGAGLAIPRAASRFQATKLRKFLNKPAPKNLYGSLGAGICAFFRLLHIQSQSAQKQDAGLHGSLVKVEFRVVP